jgi:hypothetical protein
MRIIRDRQVELKLLLIDRNSISRAYALWGLIAWDGIRSTCPGIPGRHIDCDYAVWM